MSSEAWFESWFDEDYLRLYEHRDEEEAELAVRNALLAAPELGTGPVLDLACGTGRHLEALRRRNPLAFGLDLSSTLLSRAGEGLRPWLLRGDMRRLPVKAASLSGLTLWFTPFGYFDDAGNRSTIQAIAGRLRPGGVFLLDYLNPAKVRADLVPAERLDQGGLEVDIQRSIEGNRIVKRMVIRVPGGGPTREVHESVRLYELEEILGMASDSRLRLRSAAGSYAGDPFGPGSPRWIGIFELMPQWSPALEPS